MGKQFSLEIVFAESASKNYERALRLAKRFKDYRVDNINHSNRIIIETDEFFEKANLLQTLYELVKNWKTTSIKLNGEIISYSEISRHYPAIERYGRYQNTVNQENYCSNHLGREGWGCRLLNSIERHTPDACYSYAR